MSYVHCMSIFMNHFKSNDFFSSILFHLTLLYIEKNILKNVCLVFIYYILKTYDLYITYCYILLCYFFS